ncbi:MAG: hypothetical protein JOZ93_14420, partial [Sinobacteraceae bacterium]|nr:hypothetical protein [Nevskiaceae bacterium]
HGGGVLYRIDLTTKKLKTLYDFCQISEPYCADGAGPVGRVVPYSGSIFGVTAGGGGGLQPGVIYQYTP